jgi:hypothetical protein
MLSEQLVICPDVGQLCPAALAHGAGVKVIDERVAHREQEGRVGRDDELTAVKAHRVGEKLRQFALKTRREAVFGLIEQVEGIFPDLLRKIDEGALTVGAAVRLLRQTAADIGGLGAVADATGWNVVFMLIFTICMLSVLIGALYSVTHRKGNKK